jgi:thiosulfate reductase cytochrome b subunit
MSDATFVAGLMTKDAYPSSVRHSAVVRITHWINTVAFGGLLVSGIAILRVHPRLYWGETGSIGTPSILDLPIPFLFNGQSGWGRSLHFLSAWVCILNGLLYVIYGLVAEHIWRNLVPARADLRWKAMWPVIVGHLRLKLPAGEQSQTYNVVQRLTYLTVIGGLFPLMIWTGLAMSPAITSVFPMLVDGLGGQQSARTIHFFAASALVGFLVIHVSMVCVAGFTTHMRAMLTGHRDEKEPPC